MFDPGDLRATLSSMTAGAGKAASAYAGAEYARFYETEPRERDGDARTWYARGQNFVVAYSEAPDGALLSRADQPDEYVILLPDRGTKLDVSAGDEAVAVDGFSLTIVPPGASSVRMVTGGRLVRLFSTRSADLAAKCSNAESYAEDHPNVAPFQSWPDPPGGFRIRSYSLDVPAQEGRFGRIWRCTTFMVN